MIVIKKLKKVNELEVFHDHDDEFETGKIDTAKKLNDPSQKGNIIDFDDYKFKIIDKPSELRFIMSKDENIVGIFNFEKLNNILGIEYRWVSPEYRGKGIYELFLKFLKEKMNITKYVSDSLMTEPAIKSTLKLQRKHKLNFINMDSGETLPVNDKTIKKYITNDFDEEANPWRFLITI